MINNVIKKIFNSSALAKKTGYKRKITAIENKKTSLTDLVTTNALNAKTSEIENKTPDNSNLNIIKNSKD